MKRAKAPKPGKLSDFLVDPLDKAVIIRNPPGMAKMSEVLTEFLGHHMDTWNDEPSFRAVLFMGMSCWNAAMLPVEAQDKFVKEVTGKLLPEERAGVAEELRALMRKKERLFADNKRMMLDVRIAWDPEEPYFEVLSTTDPA